MLACKLPPTRKAAPDLLSNALTTTTRSGRCSIWRDCIMSATAESAPLSLFRLLLLLQYLYWVRSNIIAGRPVIVGTRLRVSERAVDYDHIQ